MEKEMYIVLRIFINYFKGAIFQMPKIRQFTNISSATSQKDFPCVRRKCAFRQRERNLRYLCQF